MIISGESSGELYGAFLAKALKAHNTGIRIIGVGGDRMKSAGVELISSIASSFGITEAIKTFGKIRKTFRKVCNALNAFNPQVLVLIDYPDFNMRVAREAKKAGIKILYYVSPQVWAWRSGRVKTIGRLVDKMAVILPFEEDIYRKAGVSCEFAGHPVMDEIREVLQHSGFGTRDIGSAALKTAMRKDLGLIPDKPVLTLMPGSRPHEVSKLLPVITDVINEMKKLHPDYQFVIPAAPNLETNAFSEMVTHNSLLVTHNSIKALLAADSAVIASGTSTLQAAMLKVPMVVIYKLSPITFFVGRFIVKVKYISLANILLDYLPSDYASPLRIKELLQGEASRENIIMELTRISADQSYKDEMVSQLGKATLLFMDKEASLRVAGMVEELGAKGCRNA